MGRQLGRLLEEPVASPLAEVADGLAGDDLPVVDPSRPPELGSVARWANGRLRRR